VRDVVFALALAALGILLVVVFPQPTRRVMNAAQVAPAGSFGVGCLTLIVLPILFILLAITIIGIPVALLEVFVAVAAGIFGWVAIGYLAGERILEGLKVREVVPIVAVVVGVFLLTLINQVPCIGFIIGLLIGAIGLGAVVLTRFGTRTYPHTPAFAMLPAAPMNVAPSAPAPAPTVTPTPSQPPAAVSEITPAPPSETPPTSNEPPTTDTPNNNAPGGESDSNPPSA
jgi:hypothetical protein